jgi:hypothetical protein
MSDKGMRGWDSASRAACGDASFSDTAEKPVSGSKPRIPAPRGLGGAGRRLWRDVVGQYGLRVDELILLESACKTLDYIEKLDAAMADQPLLSKGSMGQDRENPLLSEVRQQRLALARLLRQIDLPELDSLTGAARSGERSSAARAMAGQRWARRGPA